MYAQSGDEIRAAPGARALAAHSPPSTPGCRSTRPWITSARRNGSRRHAGERCARTHLRRAGIRIAVWACGRAKVEAAARAVEIGDGDRSRRHSRDGSGVAGIPSVGERQSRGRRRGLVEADGRPRTGWTTQRSGSSRRGWPYSSRRSCDPRMGEEWCERELSRARARRITDTARHHEAASRHGRLNARRHSRDRRAARERRRRHVHQRPFVISSSNTTAASGSAPKSWPRRARPSHRRSESPRGRRLEPHIGLDAAIARPARRNGEVCSRAFDFTDGCFAAAEVIERTEIAVACAATGRLDEAERSREMPQDLRLGEDWRGRAGSVDWADGVTAATGGTVDRADVVRTGRRHARAVRSVIEQAEALVWWARSLEAGASRRPARTAPRAIGIYERIGAGRRFIERAESLSS